jgi:hypothetical protein
MKRGYHHEEEEELLLGAGAPPYGVMTHKYRGSQQSSMKVKPKFIDSTQGEPKNIYML